MVNYYEILDIDKYATSEQIKAAYTFQIKVFHPDRYDAAKNPMEYAQALKMTQRLNEIRDTLLDSEKRRVYDLRLELDLPESAPAPEPKTAWAAPKWAPSPTSPPRHARRRPIKLQFSGRAKKVALAAALAMAIVSAIALHLVVAGAATRLANLAGIRSNGSTVSDVCPTGAPAVRVKSVTRQPDGSYVTYGSATNTTSAPIGVFGIGFYVGPHNSGDQPDWVDQLSSMIASSNPNELASGHTISWTDHHSVYSPTNQNELGSVPVSASLDFPETPGTSLVAQWDWPNASDSCQPPNL